MGKTQPALAGAAGDPRVRLQNPCLACGACCSSFRVSFYWAEVDQAQGDGVPAAMTCQVAPLLCAMRGTDGPHPRCIALQGTVGVAVWCGIYDRRPTVCRQVVPSGQDGRAHFWCDRARAMWGLPLLRASAESLPAGH